VADVSGLTGSRVLITGAARGIGAQTARVLAGRGARLALVGLEPELLKALVAELGEGHTAYEADVTVQSSLDGAVQAAVRQLGGLDVVIANAGIAGFGTVASMDPVAFERTIDVNLTGVFRTARATLPALVESRGYLLVMASLASFAPVAGMSAYAASKAGVEAFAEALRGEVGFRGVDVGLAHPSWVDTDLVRDAAADLDSYRRMRRMLPWPARSTTSVDACAEVIVAGVARRAARIYVPRSVALLRWLRPLLSGRGAQLILRRKAAELVPLLDAETAALGRSLSRRTAALFPHSGDANLS
jgi:short-subunit dehydrogenase